MNKLKKLLDNMTSWLIRKSFSNVEVLGVVLCVQLLREHKYFAGIGIALATIILWAVLKTYMTMQNGVWWLNLKWDGTGDISTSRKDIHEHLDKLIDEAITNY